MLVGLFLATVASWGDPHLDFPVISQTVCSIKGDTWYGGGILGAPGCYTPSPLLAAQTQARPRKSAASTLWVLTNVSYGRHLG